MKKGILLFFSIFLAISLIISGCSKTTETNTSEKTMNESNENKNEAKSNSDENYNIKIATGLKKESALGVSFAKFKEIVEDKTSKKVTVEVYTDGELDGGNDNAMIKDTMEGNLEACAPSTAPICDFDNLFYALDIPYLFNDNEHAWKILDGSVGQYLLDSLSEHDLKGICFPENGFRNLTNNKLVVRKPDDVKGLKIRTMQNDIHMAMWKSLGANPMALPYGELNPSMEKGIINGQENPFENIWNDKIYENQKYLSTTRHIYSAFVFIMNKDFFESLPEDYQKAVVEAAKESMNIERKIKIESEQKCEESLKDFLEITKLTPEEVQAFRDKASVVIPQIKAKSGDEIVDKLIKASQE